MATSRKRFFVRIPEALVLREDLTTDQLGILARLLGWLNQRRYRDGLSVEEGCSAVIRPAALALITGRHQRVHAERSLRALGLLVACSVNARGELVEITWPNCAELLGWVSPSESAPGAFRTTDRNRCKNPKGLEGQNEALDELVSGLLGVPDRLSTEDRTTFRAWLGKNLPPLEPRALELERRCLEHYRLPQNRAKAASRHSWLAACEGWAREAWRLEQRQARFWPARVRGTR